MHRKFAFVHCRKWLYYTPLMYGAHVPSLRVYDEQFRQIWKIETSVASNKSCFDHVTSHRHPKLSEVLTCAFIKSLLECAYYEQSS